MKNYFVKTMNKYHIVFPDKDIDYEVGYRGGHYGMTGEKLVHGYVAPVLGLDYEATCDLINLLPNKVGAFCNYLGGGIRGNIGLSDYSKDLSSKYPKAAKLIDSYLDYCKKAYLDLENGQGLNEESYPDGDTNWEAKATKLSRKAGITSAY